ncbi:tyrosine-type recombinase/integrase [Enterococcus sp. DIV0187]|uniref:tyrosine-type recombinase/integrase n=1 Tax=Enterococcus sp. DIV0187 TaxID=2774644 RepID=UPI003F22EB7B
MSDDNVRRFLNDYEVTAWQMAPELPHLHPHLFRHSRAMHLYVADVPLPLVSGWLRHSQMETTRIYAQATIEMKREASKKLSSSEQSVFKQELRLNTQRTMSGVKNSLRIEIVIPISV